MPYIMGQLAVSILNELASCMRRVALEKELINCQGKTPDATMASALYTDVKRKPETSVFTRPEEGLFGLREWEDEGFVPEVAISSPPVVPAAPAVSQPKRIRSPGARVIKKPKRFASGQALEQYDDLLIEDCGLVSIMIWRLASHNIYAGCAQHPDFTH